MVAPQLRLRALRRPGVRGGGPALPEAPGAAGQQQQQQQRPERPESSRPGHGCEDGAAGRAEGWARARGRGRGRLGGGYARMTRMARPGANRARRRVLVGAPWAAAARSCLPSGRGCGATVAAAAGAVAAPPRPARLDHTALAGRGSQSPGRPRRIPSSSLHLRDFGGRGRGEDAEGRTLGSRRSPSAPLLKVEGGLPASFCSHNSLYNSPAHVGDGSGGPGPTRPLPRPGLSDGRFSAGVQSTFPLVAFSAENIIEGFDSRP